MTDNLNYNKGFDDIHVEDLLPELVIPPISRSTLALYAGASGDHNPIHIDSDFAQKAGMDDVIAHGMLSMAYAGRFLTNWRPQAQLKKFNTRFSAITHIHDQLTFNGKIEKKYEEDGRQLIAASLQAVDQTGEIKLTGEAIFDLTE